MRLPGYNPGTMLSALVLGLFLFQDPPPKPPEVPAQKAPVEAPKVIETWDDRRAKDAARALTKAFKRKSTSMRDRNNALEVVATGSNKALVKPLSAIIATDKSIVIRKRAAQLLANQPAKEANRTILKLLENSRVASQNNVMAELVRALSRCGYVTRHWEKIDDLFEREYDLERVPLQEALLELIAEHKEKKAIPILLRNIDQPRPANVDDASNPPAEYWEARWKSWQRWRGKVKEALFAITGQRFGSSAEAKAWLKKNRLE